MMTMKGKRDLNQTIDLTTSAEETEVTPKTAVEARTEEGTKWAVEER